MIEPLRYHNERAPTFAIKHPIYCGVCASKVRRVGEVKVAAKFCSHCEKHYFQCIECDEEIHRLGVLRHHVRRTLVLGPGIRKQVLTRGDAQNFPLLFDNVHIRYNVKVLSDGKVFLKEPYRHMRYSAGVSGKCIHVQILSARKLVAGDINGTSDPFIVGMFCGKKIGSTRVRPRTLSPNWKNETFIVPVEDNLPPPRNMPRTQRDLFRLEVFDYDYVTNNDLLGHVELTKDRLIQLASISNQRPIRLYLNAKRFHGIVGIQLGFDKEYLHLKVNRAEALGKGNPKKLSNPYAKVYFKNELIGTTSVVRNTLDPEWISSNVFQFKINDVLCHEMTLLTQKRSADFAAGIRSQNGHGMDAGLKFSNDFDIDIGIRHVEYDLFGVAKGLNSPSHEAQRPRTGTPHENPFKVDEETFAVNEINYTSEELGSITLFRIEIFHHDRFREHVHLGSSFITVDYLRKMLPNFPTEFLKESNSGLFSPQSMKLSSKVAAITRSVAKAWKATIGSGKFDIGNESSVIVEDEAGERNAGDKEVENIDHDPIYYTTNDELIAQSEARFRINSTKAANTNRVVRTKDLSITDLRETISRRNSFKSPSNDVKTIKFVDEEKISTETGEVNAAIKQKIVPLKKTPSTSLSFRSNLSSDDDEYVPKHPIRVPPPPQYSPRSTLEPQARHSDLITSPAQAEDHLDCDTIYSHPDATDSMIDSSEHSSSYLEESLTGPSYQSFDASSLQKIDENSLNNESPERSPTKDNDSQLSNQYLHEMDDQGHIDDYNSSILESNNSSFDEYQQQEPILLPSRPQERKVLITSRRSRHPPLNLQLQDERQDKPVLVECFDKKGVDESINLLPENIYLSTYQREKAKPSLFHTVQSLLWFTKNYDQNKERKQTPATNQTK
jgi:hypothetical protein